jgi:hypothetical protein
VIALGGAVVACDDSGTTYCGDGQTVCDDSGNPLIYAPYIYPAYGIYGHPGYVAPVTVYPGAPNYHTTYVNHPPNYTPPVAPKPPPANPGNKSTTVKAPAPPGYKPPTVKVQAPTVKAPSVGVNKPASPPKPAAPAPKPASPPKSK